MWSFVKDQSPDSMMSAIDSLISLLNEYKGETIVAHVHPIHVAAVRLERMCKVPDDSTIAALGDDDLSSRQTSRFMYPVSQAWYRMLWASRDSQPNYDIADGCGFSTESRDKARSSLSANPALASAWSVVLVGLLQKLRVAVSSGRYFDAVNSDKPTIEIARIFE